MAAKISGGCICGAVRYASNVEPMVSIHCHCRQCQRITGAGHASQFGLPVQEVSPTGEVRLHELIADSGNRVSSAFCPTCGNPIFKKSSGFPALIFFHAATLDDPALFKPQRIVWGQFRQPWDCVDASLPLNQ